MISEDTLGLAVSRALITAEQAEGLRMLSREAVGSTSPEPADDEALRFITGFGDIFVTIGIALFIGALVTITRSMVGATIAYAAATVTAWLLAEFFTRRRRMALPSIALLVVFAGAGLLTISSALARVFPGSSHGWFLPNDGGWSLLTSGLGTVGLVALHYLRFRVPITIAAGVAALCLAIAGLVLGLVPGTSLLALNGVVFVCGLLTFALAMRFDLLDPARATRRTDIAFWLHLLAAPMIVHTLIRGLFQFDTLPTENGAIGVLCVFVLLGLVAVIIDRRAILVSSLVYAGIAFGTLISTSGFAGSTLLVPVVLLILGAFILLLSAGWRPLRRALLLRLPAALASRLPHPLVPSAS